jgi:RNA recognition motif-containing protein
MHKQDVVEEKNLLLFRKFVKTSSKSCKNKNKNPSNITRDSHNQEITDIKNMHFKGKPHESSNGIQLQQQITT